MIYTRQVREAVAGIAVPRGFVMDIIEFQGFLLLRFYSDQWYAMSESERADAAEYLSKVKHTLLTFGIQSSIDPVVGSPQ